MQYGVINVEDDEVVEIQRKKKVPEPYPGYMIVGNGKTSRKGGTSMDLLDICKELNLAEMNLLQFFRDRIAQNQASKEKDTHKITPTRSEDWNDYLQTALKKNYPHMKCLGIIQRVKRGTYMVNPNLFIPAENMAWYAKEWEDIKEECE